MKVHCARILVIAGVQAAASAMAAALSPLAVKLVACLQQALACRNTAASQQEQSAACAHTSALQHASVHNCRTFLMKQVCCVPNLFEAQHKQKGAPGPCCLSSAHSPSYR